jgi:acetolactate synthase-1/2/3 large subunit
MNTVSGGRAVIDALRAEGVGAVFTLPGSSLLPMYDAMRELGEPVLIMTRHEQGAAHMADGYARAGRRLGVAMVTKAQGATNTVNATFVAHTESVPLVVIAGHGSPQTVHRDAFGELDLHALFAPITKLRLDVPVAARIPELLHRACRASRSGRPRPVLVTIPLEVQKASVDAAPWERGVVEPPVPSARAVGAVIDLLRDAVRPVILAGGGVTWSGAADDLLRLAEALGAPVVATFRRQDVFPNHHPLYVGVSNGAGMFAATQAALRDADVVLAIGTRLSDHSTRGYRYLAPPAKVIHVSIDSADLNKVVPAAVAIQADAGATARALLAAFGDGGVALRKRWEGRTRELREGLEEEQAHGRDEREQSGVRQGTLARELRAVMPPETILVMDAGDFGLWLDRYFPLPRPGTLVAPATGSTGFGFPAALGAQVARPDDPVLCVPVVTVVVNNFAFANIRDRQIAEYGGRIFGSEMSNPDFAAVARAFGAHGERVETIAELAGAVARARRSGLPAVIDVLVDRHEFSPGRKQPA